MDDLLDKWPQHCIPMGETVGSLCTSAAKLLSLPEGIPVIQGGPDAFVGMIGLGCIRPGQLALITGSSHLQLCVTDKDKGAAGTWGAYKGAPLKSLNVAEGYFALHILSFRSIVIYDDHVLPGGQSSTGSVLSWARRSLFASKSGIGVNDKAKIPTYKELDTEASQVPMGSDGILALETFQGMVCVLRI